MTSLTDSAGGAVQWAYRRRRSAWLVAVAVSASSASGARPAAAAEPASGAPAAASSDAEARARELFRAGAKAYDAGRFNDAVDAFLEADRLAPRADLSFNVARAYQRLGDGAAALRWYRDYLRRAPEAPDRADVERLVAGFESELAAKGVQQLTVRSVPARATVVVDGEPVGVTPWTDQLRPGEHRIVLRLAGYLEAGTTVALGATRAVEVTLSLRQQPEAPIAPAPARSLPPVAERAPAESAQPAPAARDEGGIRTPTWVALGAGTLALGGALAFELARSGSEDDAASARTQHDAQAAYDRMEGQQTTARVLAGVGATALAVGGVLLYFDVSPSGAPKGALGLSCGLGACRMAGRF